MAEVELVLTKLWACRDAKRSPMNQKFSGLGIVVANALCESFKYETAQDGWFWRQQFSRGIAESGIQKLEPTTEQWQQITFRPDPEFFGSRCLSVDFFLDWFSQQSIELGSTVVTLHHGEATLRLDTREAN
ncbi:MAG: hypothetical protein CMJ78_11270 [Planctomycetaceae bacterium]|nr:hypothetical protein [Planctomycetaceae bacterium]